MTHHAHELLEIIAHSNENLSLQTWKNIAQTQFGPESIFENCGGMQFNIDQVFDFFQMKQKIQLDEFGLVIPLRENICSGHHHH